MVVKFNFFLFFLFSFLLANAKDGFIPGLRLIDWSPGVEKGIPDVKNQIELSVDAMRAEDASKVIQNAVDSVTAPGAVLLPAGKFNCFSTIYMKSGVVLRGKGSSSTRLIFDFKENSGTPSFSFSGEGGKIFKIENDRLSAGSVKMQLSETEGLGAGDNIIVSADNDKSIMNTQPRWDVEWAERSWGQIVRITSIDGNSIEIDVPLRLDYEKSRNPTVQKLAPIENAGIENIYLKRLDKGEASMINIERCINCWFSGIESEYSMLAHIWIYDSRFLTVTDSSFHHAHSYGGGGHGYGVVAGRRACDNLITNNIFYSLRHSMMTKQGSSGNVFSYNYSFDRRFADSTSALCDVSIHGHYSHMNLFEGNVVEAVECADCWGPTGPYTTFFRNRVSSFFKACDFSKKLNIAGNTILSEPSIDASCTDLWMAANKIKGKLKWGAIKRNTKMPPSLYLKEKPPFWGKQPWPCIGADLDKSPRSSVPIPAQMRTRVKNK